MPTTGEIINLAAWTVGKTGALLPFAMGAPVRRRWQVRRLPAEATYASVESLRTASLKHNFAIRALEKPGSFKSRPRLYICLRCRKSFLVNEASGAIAALYRYGMPLPERENSPLIDSFSKGPCPGLKRPTSPHRPTTVSAQPSKYMRRLMTIIAYLFGLPRPSNGRYPIQANIAINPTELIS